MRYLLSLLLVLSLLLNVYLIMVGGGSSTLPENMAHDDNSVLDAASMPLDRSSSDSADDNLLFDAMQAFEQAQYQRAMASLLAFQGQDEALANEIAQLWLQQARRWPDDQARRQLPTLIAACRAAICESAEFQWLQAKALLLSGDYSDGLLMAQDAWQGLPIELRNDNEITWLHRQFLHYAENLQQAERWQSLETVAATWLWYEPQAADFNYFLALAQFEQKRLHEAVYPLQLIGQDSSFYQAAVKLRQRIRNSLHRESIALRRQGEHFIVDATVTAHINGAEQPLALMIDTGASMTVLTQAAFRALPTASDAHFLHSIEMQTAGGRVSAAVYRLARLQLGAYVVAPIDVAILPFDIAEQDGLLGMDVLSRFEFTLDQQQELLLIEPHS
ncbi:clan AA aspartic protease [bacterium]|nr:clan AA aspartic protease [bacterium]